MHEELNPITRLQPKMFTDRFRDGGLALDGDRGFHLSLHYILTNVIPRGQSARQAGNLPKVLPLSGLVHGLLSVARLLSLQKKSFQLLLPGSWFLLFSTIWDRARPCRFLILASRCQKLSGAYVLE